MDGTLDFDCYSLGTIQILRKHWTGLVGSENGHFCLLSVHRGWVDGSEKVQKPYFWGFSNPPPTQCYQMELRWRFEI